MNIYLVYNHRTRTGRLVDDDGFIVRELPPHRDDNPVPRFAAVAPFNYTDQFRSYLASLYLDGVLIEQERETGSMWALISICDDGGKNLDRRHLTHNGHIGFLIKGGEIFAEICLHVVEEII